MIDPYNLLRDVTHFTKPSDKIDGKLGEYHNKNVAYAHDISYIGSDRIMGKRDHPMLYYHDIVDQRPEHTHSAKTREGLQRYADQLMRDSPIDSELRHSVYHFIDRITATDSNLLQKSTVMEMRGHVHKHIQTFRPGKNAITRKLYANTL